MNLDESIIRLVAVILWPICMTIIYFNHKREIKDLERIIEKQTTLIDLYSDTFESIKLAQSATEEGKNV